MPSFHSTPLGADTRLRDSSRGHVLARILFAVFATIALLATTVSVSPAASAAVTVPRGPSGLPAAIEKPTTYVKSYACDMRTQPGTQALASFLKSTYPNVNYGLNRSCSSQGEHSDGRAIDWMATTANATTKAQAKAFITWLLKTDPAGNKFANARRLGVMYVIHDGRMWGSWNSGTGWEEYNGCSKLTGPGNFNPCHRDHVHISLSWEGARKQTSFWTKKVAATDYGPCRVDRLRWAYQYAAARATPCLPVNGIEAQARATTKQQNLVTYSGQRLALGDVGPGVAAIQAVLGVSPTGTFGPLTKSAVLAFKKRAFGVAYNALVGQGTWQALLTTYVPKAITTAPKRW